jgi:hypothetical protein
MRTNSKLKVCDSLKYFQNKIQTIIWTINENQKDLPLFWNWPKNKYRTISSRTLKTIKVFAQYL